MISRSNTLVRIAILVALITAGSVRAQAADESAAVVTRLDGNASVFAKGAKSGTPIKKSDRIMKGQEVKVGKSPASN